MAKFDKDDLVLFHDPDTTYIGKVVITPDSSEDGNYTLLTVSFDPKGNAKESIEKDVDETNLTELYYYDPIRVIIEERYIKQINYLEEC